MEHAGLAETLARHGLTLETLGLKGCTLVYRRSIGEMPVAAEREGGGAAEKTRVSAVREKLISLSTAKYLYRVLPHRVARRVVAADGRVTGIVLGRTEYRDGRLVTVEGSDETAPTPLVVSSVGSVPMPVAGIPMKGEFYVFAEPEVGRLEGFEGVYALGNVVTGKGNIAVSRRHGKMVADHVIAAYLGVGDGAERAGAVAAASAVAAAARREQASAVAARVAERPPLPPDAVAAIRGRVAERQRAIGYDGYRAWIDRVTPPDMR